MKKTSHGNPLFISKGETKLLPRSNDFSEQQIQDLIFDYPGCLPISDIDESYNPLIPVCKELWTPAGPLDILMITPNGDLVIIETKLWYNPEARRKVVAQILDYAKEISKWTYSDLQREVNKKIGEKGNCLYQFSTKTDSNSILSEIDFVDAVSRNLRLGKFLLIIAGDGIREGANEIAEFLTIYGNLNFALAMVELSIFNTSEGDTIIFPRTNVKTVEIQKVNIEVAAGLQLISDSNPNTQNVENENVSEDLQKRREFFTNFWTEFLDQLTLDDPGQPLPEPTKYTNLYLYPGRDKTSWISAYFAKSSGRVGVYFRFNSNQVGHSLKERLEVYKEEIKAELDENDIWSWEDNQTDGFGIRLPIQDVHAPENREVIMNFFSEHMNRYVNIIRPRLKLI